MYDDLAYAQSRLTGSLVSLKDYERGVLSVNDVRSSSRVKGDFVLHGDDKQGEQVVVPIKSMNFSVGELGYVNSNYPAVYLIRLPIKHSFKQGLRTESLAVVRSYGLTHIGAKEIRLGYSDFKRGLTDCLFNLYPSLEAALIQLEEQGGAVAVSKHFAIDENYHLNYRGFTVGKLTSKDKLRLSDDYKFLSEELTTEVGYEQILA